MNSFYGGKQGLSFIIARAFPSVADMVEKFKLGPDYDEVRFDEYVIINTKNKNDPTNGNIYRRGYNYKDDDKLAGALFVGSVVGPAGYTPSLEFNTYNYVDGIRNNHNYPESKEGWSYRGGTGQHDEANKDLVPGMYKEGNTKKYNDAIKWVYCSIRTTNNEESLSLLGYRIPYHVPDFISSSVSPYYNRSNQTNNFINQNLVTRLLTDSDGSDLTKHPFYSKWDIKIPKGIHGQNIENIRVMTPTTSIDYGSGADTKKQEDINNNYKIFALDIRNFDKTETGEVKSYYVGDYNMIDNTAGRTPTLNTQTGEFKIYYTHAPTSTWYFRYPLSFTLDEKGVLTTHYSHGADTVQEQKIKWITDVISADNGTITIKFNTGTTVNGTFTNDTLVLGNKVKWITNTEILTGNPEGSGSQKLKITYNTGDTQTIGNPLNYIMKTVVETENYHLLAYFSDPARRASDPRRVTYNGEAGWVDLGCVKDDSGILIGLNIIDSEVGIAGADYENSTIRQQKEKEYLLKTYPNGLQNQSDPREHAIKGKVVTFGENTEVKNFYAYDYVNREWIFLGTVSEYSKLATRIDELKKELEKTNGNVAANKTSITNLTETVNNHSTKLTQLENKINTNIQDIKDLSTKVTTNTNNITANSDRLDQHAQQILALQNKDNELSSRLDALEKDRDDLLEAFRIKINSLERFHIKVSNGLTPILTEIIEPTPSNDVLLGITGNISDSNIIFTADDTFSSTLMKLTEGLVDLRDWKRYIVSGASPVMIETEGEYDGAIPDEVNQSTLVVFEDDYDIDDKLAALKNAFRKLCIWKYNVMQGLTNVMIEVGNSSETPSVPGGDGLGGAGAGSTSWGELDDENK